MPMEKLILKGNDSEPFMNILVVMYALFYSVNYLQ